MEDWRCKMEDIFENTDKYHPAKPEIKTNGTTQLR